MKRVLLLVAVLLAVGVLPVSAARPSPSTRSGYGLGFDGLSLRGPMVAEINWFFYDECENVFWWQTDSEINIWAFRLEHPLAGWTGDLINSANYQTMHGATYAIYGPMFADLAGDYMLRVYFDNGFSRMEDVAERVCDWKANNGISK